MAADLNGVGAICADSQGDIYAIARGTVTAETGKFDIPILKKFKQP